MDKVAATALGAVADVPDGASLEAGGFGLQGVPSVPIRAITLGHPRSPSPMEPPAPGASAPSPANSPARAANSASPTSASAWARAWPTSLSARKR